MANVELGTGIRDEDIEISIMYKSIKNGIHNTVLHVSRFGIVDDLPCHSESHHELWLGRAGDILYSIMWTDCRRLLNNILCYTLTVSIRVVISKSIIRALS